MTSFSRRAFLHRSLLGSSGLALASLFPGALACRAGDKRQRADLSSIGHVVIFMQENRSFDHYFGTLAGVRGYGDPHALRLLSGDAVFAQPNDPNAPVYPFRLDGSTTSGQCVPDVAHDWYTGRQARAEGRMDGWYTYKGADALGYYTRGDLPFHYALADAFTVCDHYFCSANTSTNPNRLFLWTGTVDAAGRFEGPVMDNGEAVPFTWTTYPERLEDAGISWQVFQEVDNYDDNALAWFQTFKQAPVGSSLYERGMRRGNRMDFVDAVATDSLPAVSWIIAPGGLSEHPAAAPNKGADLCKFYLDALAANPTVWAKTVFIYTMDENGGFFDHVVPPTAPPGTPDEYALDLPIGFGARVPTIVVSPFSTGGYVCSEVMDHTSILRFLELFTGVAEPNISAWRRKVSGDLTSALDLRASGAAFPGGLPATAALAAAADVACATLPAAAPNGETAAPVQESGNRPLRALPYQLAADLSLDPVHSRVRIGLHNTGSRAAVLSVHGLVGVDVTPVFATLDAGASTNVDVDTSGSVDGLFDLELHGPNGFFRRFAGSVRTAPSGPDPSVRGQIDRANETLRLTVHNPATVAITATFSDALGAASGTQSVAAGTSATWVVPLVDRWYDVSVGLLGEVASRYARSYAGHLEGEEGVTRAG